MADTLTPETIQKGIAVELETLLSLKPGTITTETSLPTLGVDSLRFVSLLLAIEQKFGVNLMKIGVKPDDLKTIVTFAAAVKAGRPA